MVRPFTCPSWFLQPRLLLLLHQIRSLVSCRLDTTYKLKREQVVQSTFLEKKPSKEKKFCCLPSLVKINEENCVIPEARHSVSSRHSNDEGKNIVDESVECLCEKVNQSLYQMVT